MQGADPAVVRLAVVEGEPLPGTDGFAGELDGALVRDVLGRYPLFVDADVPSRWSHDPTDLDAPDPVTAGHLRRIESPSGAGDPDASEECGHARSGTTDPDGADGPALNEGPEKNDDPVEECDPVKDCGPVKNDGPNGTDERENRIWSLPDPEVFPDDATAVDEVRDAVTRSVDAVVDHERDGQGSPAIAFSGGVDSAILAARLDGSLYVGGFEGSHDVEAARAAASALDREDALEVVPFTHADLERAVTEVVRATGRRNPMDVQIALPLYLVAERVAADGHDRLAVGQGADELFGGYAKVADPADHPRVDAGTVRGATRELIAGLPDQLERDVLVLRAAGVEPVRPLLHDRVLAAALRLPDRLLVDDGVRKVALRRAADFLPESVRTRDKKAVQYGSLVAREFDRLARQAGFKRRVDDHLGKFIDSLVD